MKPDELAKVTRILVYKRVHNGDPGEEGIFGRHNCMVRVRGSAYDAVIGIGGKSTEPTRYKINYKINWIGIGPEQLKVPGKKVPEIRFEHFHPFREAGWFPVAGQEMFRDAPSGPLLCEESYILADAFYTRRYAPRFRILDKSKGDGFADALAILRLAINSSPSQSKSTMSSSQTTGCYPKKPRGNSDPCKG